MGKLTLTKSAKDKHSTQNKGHSYEQTPLSNMADPQASILALQHAVGNQAVSHLLQPNAYAFAKFDKSVPPIVRAVLNSGSQPLGQITRDFMESRFGYDFSLVRMHNDIPSAKSADVLNAKAYTVGKDVVFGSGYYQPETAAGKQLLAHELAHVIQQDRGRICASVPLSESMLEQAADQAALTLAQSSVSIQVTGASAPGLARQPLDQGQELPKFNNSQKGKLNDIVNLMERFGIDWTALGLKDRKAVIEFFSQYGKVDDALADLKIKLQREIDIKGIYAEAQSATTIKRVFSSESPESQAVKEIAAPDIPKGTKLPRGTEKVIKGKGGYWGGERGHALWYSEIEEVNKITNYKPIPFRNGKVDFSQWAVERAIIPNMTGNDDKDFAQADRSLAYQKPEKFENQTKVAEYRKKNKLTWHHDIDEKTMLLVPFELNDKVPHVGGASSARKRPLNPSASHIKARVVRSKPIAKKSIKPIAPKVPLATTAYTPTASPKDKVPASVTPTESSALKSHTVRPSGRGAVFTPGSKTVKASTSPELLEGSLELGYFPKAKVASVGKSTSKATPKVLKPPPHTSHETSAPKPSPSTESSTLKPTTTATKNVGVAIRGESSLFVEGLTWSKGVLRAQAGAAAVAQFIGPALERLNELGIRYRIESDLEKLRPKIEEYQMAHPDQGVLVVVTLQKSKIVTDPGVPGPLPSVLITHNPQYGGETKKEAITRWVSEPKLTVIPGKGFTGSDEYIWFPPNPQLQFYKTGIIGKYRSNNTNQVLHISFDKENVMHIEAWDSSNGEKYLVNASQWKTDFRNGVSVLRITFTKRSTGLIIDSEIKYVDPNTLQESYEIRSYHNYGARSESILRKTLF
ncbi:MAG: DUF4157 domain-containing protein [Candidatus Jettenia sp.]|uniref:eCIS core domain-containing protein n=1 Tax=Candidatus Jettenia caeni TaxID=247490 RepID=I3IIB2_9BACT|nr:DUF4157 domain-containing protein [Candidatus Jettenia sp. AMX1]MBC6928303.1 DUF4157 domain-containing protein [Candidatus Jettenia sp.]GAB61457.1 conserved hypothetical protein [Candidatus Jettenia caeni]KAA0249936.1 MAG: DUF4157 domain-containing protein [Candidatus Jettenia sp. AMX1]MCE7880414.1 DUF4157 domain-containing protein [Candidatus Jettenia sp. AMX1]MCQ3926222.1 DUF4157 domain-containing protein [Candidatus Jettenia sp.]